jgi:activating signal cointegrator 1
MKTIKALSLWQPFAHALVIRAKTYETRSWETRYRGVVAIHAAKRPAILDVGPFSEQEQQSLEEVFGATMQRRGHNMIFPDLPTGCIVGVGYMTSIDLARYVDPVISVQERALGDYSEGRFAWHFSRMVALATPLPCKGRQGLWNTPVCPVLHAAIESMKTPEERSMRDPSLPAPPTGYAGKKYRVVQEQLGGRLVVWGWTNEEDGGQLARDAKSHPLTVDVLVEHEERYSRKAGGV